MKRLRVRGLSGGTVGGDYWNNPVASATEQGTGAAFMTGVTSTGIGPAGPATVTPDSSLYFATQATAQAMAAKYGGTVVPKQSAGTSAIQYYVSIGGALYNAGLLANEDSHGDVNLTVVNPSVSTPGVPVNTPAKTTIPVTPGGSGNAGTGAPIQSTSVQSSQTTASPTSSTSSTQSGGAPTTSAYMTGLELWTNPITAFSYITPAIQQFSTNPEEALGILTPPLLAVGVVLMIMTGGKHGR